mmetsp:Transcript_10217/g.8769  ORF Transcript_10217/g.8769 Transcript_10217/m.8769 type:complete len:146 (-) Transcript_10217:1028-1465(-)
MGNTHTFKPDISKNNFGQIYVQPDKASYLPGDTVTGSIYLYIAEPVKAKNIYLKIKGKEHDHRISEHYDSETNITTYSHDKRKHMIFKKRIKVYECLEEIFLPGQYVFPFGFALQEDLPASFFQEGKHFLADLSYTLSASILNLG